MCVRLCPAICHSNTSLFPCCWCWNFFHVELVSFVHPFVFSYFSPLRINNHLHWKGILICSDTAINFIFHTFQFTFVSSFKRWLSIKDDFPCASNMSWSDTKAPKKRFVTIWLQNALYIVHCKTLTPALHGCFLRIGSEIMQSRIRLRSILEVVKLNFLFMNQTSFHFFRMKINPVISSFSWLASHIIFTIFLEISFVLSHLIYFLHFLLVLCKLLFHFGDFILFFRFLFLFGYFLS